MKKLLVILLFLCLLSAQAWAEVQTLYVRTTADCTANGCGSTNGSSFANAYNGMADISFSAVDNTALSVDPEDILIICALEGQSFGDADKDVSTSMIQPSAAIDGTSASAMTTFDGDCSAQTGYASRAKWDGGGTLDRGFDFSSTSRRYIKVKNLEITGFDTKGVFAQGLYTDNKDCELDNLWIHDLRGASAVGVDIRGIGCTLKNSTISNIGNDAVYWEGANATITDNVIQYPSLDTVTGDGVQFDKSAANTTFLRNIIRNGVDIKQCFFASTTLTGDGYGLVADNKCYGPIASGYTASSHVAFFVENASTASAAGNKWVFLRNYAEKTRYLIYAGGDASDVKMIARSNLGRLVSGGIQGGTGTSDHIIQNNSIYGAEGVCFSTEAATGTSVIQNNIGVGCATSGIRKNAGDTESYNNIYASGDVVQNESTPTTPGTGTITTNPNFIGNVPTTIEGFRLKSSSGARRAGINLNQALTDYRGRPFSFPSSIGAYEVTSGDEASSRTTASARTNASSRTNASTRTARQ